MRKCAGQSHLAAGVVNDPEVRLAEPLLREDNSCLVIGRNEAKLVDSDENLTGEELREREKKNEDFHRACPDNRVLPQR